MMQTTFFSIKALDSTKFGRSPLTEEKEPELLTYEDIEALVIGGLLLLGTLLTVGGLIGLVGLAGGAFALGLILVLIAFSNL
jgi:hypothetical protein